MIDLWDIDDPEVQERLQAELEAAMEPLDNAYCRTLQHLEEQRIANGLGEEATLAYRAELREAMKVKRRAVLRQVIAKMFGRIVNVRDLNGAATLQ